MNNFPSFAAIITAAGKSERFNKNQKESVKKEYLSINGHTVLYRAAEPFFEIPGLAAVCITCPEGSEDETLIALEDLADINTIPFLIIPGGRTRKESVSKALNALRSFESNIEYVAIHDGARPFITPDLIIKTLAAATIAGSAAPAIRINDSVKRLEEDGMIKDSVDRLGLVRVQTPQIFRYREILDAHNSSNNSNASDDIEIYLEAGHKCMPVQGSNENWKITYISDIPDADNQIREYLRQREEGRKSAKATRRMRELLFSNGEEE